MRRILVCHSLSGPINQLYLQGVIQNPNRRFGPWLMTKYLKKLNENDRCHSSVHEGLVV